MKRILIFSLAYHPHVGGAEIAIKEITDRLGDLAFDMVTLRLSPQDAVQEKVGTVQVYRVGGPKFLYPLVAALKARSLHRQNKYDGAWAMMSYMAVPALLSGLPYALTLQDGDTEAHVFGRLRVLPFLPLITAGFRRARVVQAISTYLAGWAHKRGYQGKVVVVPNGVDIQKFAGEPVPHPGVVLVTSSRLVHKNGVDTIIRALTLVPEVQLVVCGSGPDEAALKALAKNLGVQDRVQWRGHVAHSDLPRHLHHADIFVRPSRSEGMGNSFVEAFAAGLPTIATQVGGLADFITSSHAWPVAPDNPQEIALQIKAILGNPVRTQEVIQTAKQLAAQKYNWDTIAKDMRERVFGPLGI